jgi:hypothetical protein
VEISDDSKGRESANNPTTVARNAKYFSAKKVNQQQQQQSRLPSE